MSEWIIYHNPKCSKSRQTLALLEEAGIEPKIVEYLKNPLSSDQLRSLMSSLGGDSKSMVRTKEDEYKSEPFDVNDVDSVIENLSAKPKLLERPIVLKGTKAVIGRPPENVQILIGQ